MRKLIFKVTGAIPIIVLSDSAVAYGRGGSCGEGALCTFTEILVGLILLGLFLLSIVANIIDKGFIRGITQHAGVQGIFFYCTGVFVLAWITAKLMELGKIYTVIFCVVAMIVCYRLFATKPKESTKRDD